MPSGNKNGVPNSEKTRFTSGEKAATSGRKGGVASGKAKRDKKKLQECINILLEQKIKTTDGRLVTGAEAISAKLFERAVRGDIRAFEVLRDTAGQKPVEHIRISEVDQEMIDEVEKLFNE